MQRLVFITLLLTLLHLDSNSQTYFDFTTNSNRKKHDQRLQDSVIIYSLNKTLSATTEKNWVAAFWAMELMLYKTAFTKDKISQAWEQVNERSESFQKALLEVTYTLYQNEFNTEAKTLLQQTNSPAVFIRCAEYLLSNKQKIQTQILDLINKKFSTSDYVGFTILKQRLGNTSKSTLPPLQDIFSKDFLPGKTVVYSLQRSNRNYPGLVVIRKEDGTFVKDSTGNIFHAQQLARAITNYPFYITNGNTPQGIYRWLGFDTSSNAYIGPTPNLQMWLPLEATTSQFFGDSTIHWSESLYTSLLPSSWKSYSPIYESYWAGSIGRSEIIMHGTTINPAYYRNQSYYPQTPSLGCLCSYEEWKDGKLVYSNQQKIYNALLKINAKEGYVVVVDLNDESRPVLLSDLTMIKQSY
jgi:hypothetical protein